MLAGYNPKYDFGIAMFTGSANNMNCSMPANMTVDNMAFFYDTLCPLYDEVWRKPRVLSLADCTLVQVLFSRPPCLQILYLVTNGSAPRLNCSACPLTASVYQCMSVPSREPSCQAYFEQTPCGQNKTIATNSLLCDRCVAKYEKNASSVCHSKYGLYAMCPPSGSTHRPSPPVNCDWSHIA